MLVDHLVELAERAYNVNPGRPVPMQTEGGAEMGLEPTEDENDGEKGEGWLGMEDDALVAFDEAQFLLDLPEESPAGPGGSR